MRPTYKLLVVTVVPLDVVVVVVIVIPVLWLQMG